MMKVKVVGLGGYDGWNVVKESEIEVEEWSVEGVVDGWLKGNEWSGGDDEEVMGEIRKDMLEKMVVMGGVMSLMGEEMGDVFVLME